MSLSEPSGMKREEPAARVQPAFNWIDFIAVPIASSLMETQPIALGFMFILLISTGVFESWPFDEASITLLLLGLQWWALLVNAVVPRDPHGKQAQMLRILGLLLAFTAILGTHISLLTDTPALLLSIVLLLWSWWRGMHRAQIDLSHEQVVTVFRIGLIVMLCVLTITMIISQFSMLVPVLAYALPLFFLSGLIALSFTRIGMIRRENANHPEASQTATTRLWLLSLTIAWSIIVVVAIVLEIASFQFIQNALQPLWNILGLIVYWMLLLLDRLLGGIFSLFGPPHVPNLVNPTPNAPLRPPATQHPPPAIPAEILLIGRIVLLILVLVILLLVIRLLLQRWFRAHSDENAEELREGLAVRSILRARRQERAQRKQEAVFALEPLDPTSARAHYRELLQTMAQHENELARHPDETPAEYQMRLQTFLEKAHNAVTHSEEPPDAAILQELTYAYMRERYGGKHTAESERAYLGIWGPQLVKRLTINKPAPPSTTERT